ncbi:MULTISPECIES: hypothetical protein [unclassified Roseitalea]|uniref:hypothetical protein n=1 Tax=unclassified Roseitalea TaxID=2639107 RepID=UPI00273DF640|nr:MULTISPECIES: hypothetical protein [unclassified Roseitalea]
MATRISGGIAGLLALLGAGAPAAAGETATVFMAQCAEISNWPETMCACIGELAETELSDQQQEFFVAMVSKDEAAMHRWRLKLTVAELTQVGMLMTTGAQRCANR